MYLLRNYPDRPPGGKPRKFSPVSFSRYSMLYKQICIFLPTHMIAYKHAHTVFYCSHKWYHTTPAILSLVFFIF